MSDRPSDLPRGRALDLAGRGTTFALEVHAPGDPHDDNAPTVILLHGWTVTSAMNFFPVLRPLGAEGLHVVAMDQRGHGRGIPCTSFRLEDCADDVAALVAHLGVERAVVVGYSMGGAIAQLVGLRHPSIVQGLVLCSTTAYFASESGQRSAWDVIGPVIAAGLAHLPVSARQLLLDRFLMYRGTEIPEWMQRELRRNDPAAIAQAGFELGKFDTREELGALTMPVAVVRTLHDSTIAPHRQSVLLHGLPHGRGFDVAADHRAIVTDTALFLPQLIDAIRWVLSS